MQCGIIVRLHDRSGALKSTLGLLLTAHLLFDIFKEDIDMFAEEQIQRVN